MLDEPTLFKRVCTYMTDATSIIGAAVAAPAFAAAVSGHITWAQAAIPLLGAAIAIGIPERKTTPPSAAETVDQLIALSDNVAKIIRPSLATTIDRVAGEVKPIADAGAAVLDDYLVRTPGVATAFTAPVPLPLSIAGAGP